MVCIGEGVGFARQVVRRFGEAGQHAFEQHLEALLGECQAGGQGDDLVFHLRIETLQGPPGGFGYRTIAG